MIADDFLSIRPDVDESFVTRALEYYKEKRLKHVLGCTQEACRLAGHYGLDEDTAFTAALLHDITKKLSTEKQLQLCDKYGIVDKVFLQDAPSVLHAYTGAEVAKDSFGVSDEIADAIRFHTSGRAGMTDMEKLVFLADAIEPTRDYEGVEELRPAAYESLD